MVYIENTGLRDCSGFLQIGSHMRSKVNTQLGEKNIFSTIFLIFYLGSNMSQAGHLDPLPLCTVGS